MALRSVREAARRYASLAAEMRVYRNEASVILFDQEGLLRRLYTDSDRCFVFYDAVVMRSTDEAVMLQAQDFTPTALGRLDSLQELMRYEIVA